MSSRISARPSIATSRSAVPFVPQPQEKGLAPKALEDLERLRRQGLDRHDLPDDAKLDKCLVKAAEYLKTIVIDLNERGAEERTRRLNKIERQRKNGEQESVEEKEAYDQFQQKVNDLTSKMDQGIRRVIDDEAWASRVPASIQHIITTSRRIQVQQQAEADRGDEDEDEDDEGRRTSTRTATEAALDLLQAAQSTSDTQWAGQTLTEKYSRNPTYEDFYKLKHNAQNPGEHPPPIPHPDMWFAVEEGKTTQQHHENQADDDNSDIEIGGEKISCKCPLTLQYFKEPITSKKCPHSFEKEAILGLIRQSGDREPLTPEQHEQLDLAHPRGSRGRGPAEAQMIAKNPKTVRCPERGCEKVLGLDDFRADVALQRRTQRVQEAEQRAREAEDDDDSEESEDGFAHTQRRRRVVPIGSSPASGRRRTWVKGERLKGERLSMVPDSQTPSHNRMISGRRRGPVDVDDVDDEDDMED